MWNVGRVLSVAAFCGAVSSVMVAGCGDAPPAQAPSRSLPPYTGQSVKLFDDGIDAQALNFNLEKTDSQLAEAILRKRLQAADGVLRVRVTTFTSKDEDSGRSYQIGFKTIAKLGGANPPPAEFVVVADKASPSAGLLKMKGFELIGTGFIAFVSSFARADGDPELHFHLAPDTEQQLAAIRSASVLSEFAQPSSK